MSIGLGLGGLTRLTGTVGGGNTGVVLTSADLASLPGAVTNGAIYDVTSPAVRVEGVGGAWTVTGASGGGVYSAADGDALIALSATLAAGSVAIAAGLTALAGVIVFRYSSTVVEAGGWYPIVHGSGVVSVSALRVGSAGGSDPVADDGWSDVSTGTPTTDYTIGVDGAVTQYRKISTTGAASVNSDVLIVAADTATMQVIDTVTPGGTQATGLRVAWYAGAYVGAAEYKHGGLAVAPEISGTNWTWVYGGASFEDTSIPFGTDQTMWVIRSATRTTIVSSDGGLFTTVNLWTVASDPTVVGSCLERCGTGAIAGTASFDRGGIGVYRVAVA